MDPRAQMLTTGEAAALVGVSRITIVRWAESGKIRAHRLPSGRWRIDRVGIAPFIPADPQVGRTIGEQCGVA